MDFRPDQDIFASGVECVINTVNCHGVMGAGLAKAFAQRYPAILEPYKRACAEKTLKPGGVQLIRVDRASGRRGASGDLLIANVATKDHWKQPSQAAWVDAALGKLARALEERQVRSVAIPKLGAGLGGLDWATTVRPLVEKHFAGPASRGMKVMVLGEGPEAERTSVSNPSATMPEDRADRTVRGQVALPLDMDHAPATIMPGSVVSKRKLAELTGERGRATPARDGAAQDAAGSKAEADLFSIVPKNGRHEIVSSHAGAERVWGRFASESFAKKALEARREEFSGQHAQWVSTRAAVAAVPAQLAAEAEIQARREARREERQDQVPTAGVVPSSETGILPAYAGIGARDTPPAVIARMQEIGRLMASKGFVLRSGAADGADSAFETGCDAARGPKEIYLPWKGFNKREPDGTGTFAEVTPAHEALACSYHPSWDRLGRGARSLMARNASQMLGRDLATPSRLVICYTDGGAVKGGTGQSLRMAADRGIPVINLGDPRWRDVPAAGIVSAAEVHARGGSPLEAQTVARATIARRDGDER